MDGVEHSRAGDGCGIATSLQREFIVIDAARDIRRQDQDHVHGFRRVRFARRLNNSSGSERNDGQESGDPSAHSAH
jgi:hypothetical protein